MSGGGSSDLTRYVAKHDLDRRREGDRARPLFTEHADDLTFWAARKWLNITGGELSRDDVLHYVLSFENPPDYKNLGKDDRERAMQIRAALRQAIAAAAKEIGVEGWRWAAGIHLNNLHPHVHILFNKNAISRRTGELTRVAKLLSPPVAHYREGADKTREFDYGVVINSFAEHVDERIRAHAQARTLTGERMREATRSKERPTLHSDRMLLGESMLARHETERLSAQVDSLRKRKWKSPEHLVRLESRLDEAHKNHESLKPHVENLRARYKESGAPLPLPLLSPADVRKMQDEAIERRDAERISVLEKIRLGLAAERGVAPSDHHGRGRLTAQLREAETDVQAREWRDKEFERSSHLIPFAIDGNPLSLARIDTRLERERVKTSFIHTGIAAYFPSQRQAVQEEMEQLQTLRREVEDRIHTRQKELNAEREQAAATVKILREIRESDSRASGEVSHGNRLESVSPIYTRAELAWMETRAHWMHDAGLLREVHEARRASRARLAPEKREPFEALAARSLAHETIAKLDLEEAKEARSRQANRSRFTPVAARLADGSIITGSVRQTEIITRAEAIIHIVENTPERRERNAAITRAAAARDSDAQSRFEAVSGYFIAARSIAEDYRQELAREGKEMPTSFYTKRIGTTRHLPNARHERTKSPPSGGTSRPQRTEVADVCRALFHRTRLLDCLAIRPAQVSQMQPEVSQMQPPGFANAIARTTAPPAGGASLSGFA